MDAPGHRGMVAGPVPVTARILPGCSSFPGSLFRAKRSAEAGSTRFPAVEVAMQSEQTMAVGGSPAARHGLGFRFSDRGLSWGPTPSPAARTDVQRSGGKGGLVGIPDTGELPVRGKSDI